MSTISEQFAAAIGSPSPPPLAQLEPFPVDACEDTEPEWGIDEEYDEHVVRARKLPPLPSVQAEKARRHLRHFMRYAWGVLDPADLHWNWHHDLICDYLEELVRGYVEKKPSRNATINIPPGTTKSRMVSVMLPAWAWLQWPHLSFLCLSANYQDVALRDAEYMRELVTSSWYRNSFKPSWKLSTATDAKSMFKNTAGGFRSSKGLNAKVTGGRADIQIIDDAHDAEEAQSEQKRKAVVNRYSTSCWNRVNDARHAVRINVGQRVHEEDLGGWAIEQGWEVRCFPMRYEKEHPHVDAEDPRTEEGEVLHPERFTEEVLAADEKALGAFGVAGQLQQRPSPDEGGMFKRRDWRFFRPDGAYVPRFRRDKRCNDSPAIVLPKLHQVVISVDAAFTKSDQSDYVCLGVIGRADDTKRYVLEVINQRLTFTETCAELKKLSDRYPNALWKLIEKKANGDAIIDSMTSLIPGLIAINPEGGKVSRAHACSPAVQAGEVYLLDGAEWTNKFIDQLAGFPNVKHDDMVDMFSQAMNYLASDVDIATLMMLGKW